MNEKAAGGPPEIREGKLTGRDWVILPAIGLLTILVVLATAEIIARRIFTETETAGLDTCMELNDSSSGARQVPNCVCSEKSFETPLVEYRFNSCGDRTEIECGVKLPGVYRIVLIGSSFSSGKRVLQEETFAARLPASLSERSGRKVEIYNRGILMWGTPRVISMQMDRTLAAQPDLILMMLSPWDIDNVSVFQTGKEERSGELGSTIVAGWSEGSLAQSLKVLAGWSRAVFMTKELLYRSQSQYVRSFLMQDKVTDMLRAEPTPALRSKLNELEVYIGQIQSRAAAAGVPLAVVFVPNRAQAAMIAMGKWPSGYDPYMLGREIQKNVKQHQAIYIDILPDYRLIANPERGYYPIDGHPNANGSLTLSAILAKELSGGSVEALRPDRQPTMLSRVE